MFRLGIMSCRPPTHGPRIRIKGPGILDSLALALLLALPAISQEHANVWIQDVPAYSWHYGCYGGASGMLMGFWDRIGYSNLYTGPTAGGIAPINAAGTNIGIVSLWASKAGFDGRPADQPGHVDDYYVAYQSTAPDPWLQRGIEHEPDCLGDFMGMSQNKWTNLANECRGNRDAYAFNFFDTSGARRINFQPTGPSAEAVPDIQSGLRAFADWRGYDAVVFSQLLDIWRDTPAGEGFTFEDLRCEIDAGRPVLLHLQEHAYAGADGFNPDIHAFVAVGYVVSSGLKQVRVRTGWSDNVNDYQFWEWTTNQAFVPWGNPLYPRGAIGFRLNSIVTRFALNSTTGCCEWIGPLAVVTDAVRRIAWTATWHVVEMAESPHARWAPVSTASPGRRIDFLISQTNSATAVFRLRRLEPACIPDTGLRTAIGEAVTVKWGPSHILYDLDISFIQSLDISGRGIADLRGLENAVSLTNLVAATNNIEDLSVLLTCLAAGGLPPGSRVDVSNNPLSNEAVSNQIPVLIAAGVDLVY